MKAPSPFQTALGLALALASVGCRSQTSVPSGTTVAKAPVPSGMVLIPGGEFQMGWDEGLPDERPAHRVTVSPFYIDAHEVTNREFAKFVEQTGYITTAEKPLRAEDFPGVPKEKLTPGSGVFREGIGWEFLAGAYWRQPSGPGSTIEDKMDHPVVQVSWFDAQEYAKWAGKRLPTEAEWEYAARFGRAPSEYLWGDEEISESQPEANIWQGDFPSKNLSKDGFAETAPVGKFPPTVSGLFDMAGNVWEWTSDWYRPDAHSMAKGIDPQGPEDSFDPDEPGVSKRVLKGGSFLCSAGGCRGYRPSARLKTTPDSGLMHLGFRCVKSAPATSGATR